MQYVTWRFPKTFFKLPPSTKPVRKNSRKKLCKFYAVCYLRKALPPSSCLIKYYQTMNKNNQNIAMVIFEPQHYLAVSLLKSDTYRSPFFDLTWSIQKHSDTCILLTETLQQHSEVFWRSYQMIVERCSYPAGIFLFKVNMGTPEQCVKPAQS